MEHLIQFVTDYGYWAVFSLVFLQEIGIPNPVPNELILLFGGALTVIGGLNFWLMFLTVIAADVIGTTILFSAFYFFEYYLLERISKWLPINKNLDRIKTMLVKHDRWAILLGRLMPYLRGYVSVAAGVLNIPYRVFLPMVAISATIWSGGYVIAGHFLGTQWEKVGDFISRYQWIFLIVLTLTGLSWWIWKHQRNRGTSDSVDRN